MKSQRIEIGVKKELQQMVKDGRLQDKEIYAMGSISNIAHLDDILKKYRMSISMIVDNDPQKKGRHLYKEKEYEIVDANYFFRKRNKNTVLLIYSIRFWCEMKDQMIRHGLKEFLDFYVLESLTLNKKKMYVERGYSLLGKIRRKYGEDAFILAFHGPIGDNYLFSLFCRQYLAENGIGNYVCVGTSVTKKIINLFGFPQFVLLEREDFLALEYLYMFLGSELEGVKFLQIWEFAFHFNRDRIRFGREFNFMDTYRDYVYCLHDNREPAFPVFSTCTKKVAATFKRMGLEKGNTVIVSPYAYSIQKQPPKLFWIKLVDALLERGKKVVMNINPKAEKNFISKIPVLKFPVEDSVPYLEYAGGFIGMRSGLCDVISSAACRKLLLYPKEDLTTIDYDRHRADKEFGGLQAMGLTDQVIELEYDMSDSSQDWHGFVELVMEAWENGI